MSAASVAVVVTSGQTATYCGLTDSKPLLCRWLTCVFRVAARNQ